MRFLAGLLMMLEDLNETDEIFGSPLEAIGLRKPKGRLTYRTRFDRIELGEEKQKEKQTGLASG